MLCGSMFLLLLQFVLLFWCEARSCVFFVFLCLLDSFCLRGGSASGVVEGADGIVGQRLGPLILWRPVWFAFLPAVAFLVGSCLLSHVVGGRG